MNLRMVWMLLLPVCGSAYLTDLNVHAEPGAPALPAAGGVFTDPVFGSRIMRVTDSGDGNQSQNAYSYWASFNKDATYFHIHTGNLGATLYHFDPVNFKILSKGKLFTANPPGGGAPGWEDAAWSGTTANVIFAHEGPRIWSYDVRSGTYVLVKNFSARFPGEYSMQMSRSIDDDVFGFTRRKSSDYSQVGYAVWKRSTDSVLLDVTTAQLDEIQVDKTGRYCVIKTGLQGAGAVEVKVADLQTGTVTDLTDNGPDFAPGHSDNGRAVVAGADNWTNRSTFRSLATPHQVSTVFSFGSDWTQSDHLSFLADDENWVLLSCYYVGGASSGLFKNEIFQVSVDGSKQVRRICHHRSDYAATREYWDSPRANISRDGQFVAYSSNWDNSGRRDVFIAEVFKTTGAENRSAPHSGAIRIHTGSSITLLNVPAGAPVAFYNGLGRRVKTLTAQTSGPVVWRGDDSAGRHLAPGVYVYRLLSPARPQSGKVLLAR